MRILHRSKQFCHLKYTGTRFTANTIIATKSDNRGVDKEDNQCQFYIIYQLMHIYLWISGDGKIGTGENVIADKDPSLLESGIFDHCRRLRCCWKCLFCFG